MIFMNLHKAYGALDRGRYLEILEGSDVIPLDRCILHTY